MNIYVITADYRPKNTHKPRYYVMAENKAKARERFEDCFGWLKIYDIDKIEDETSVPRDAILFRQT